MAVGEGTKLSDRSLRRTRAECPPFKVRKQPLALVRETYALTMEFTEGGGGGGRGEDAALMAEGERESSILPLVVERTMALTNLPDG